MPKTNKLGSQEKNRGQPKGGELKRDSQASYRLLRRDNHAYSHEKMGETRMRFSIEDGKKKKKKKNKKNGQGKVNTGKDRFAVSGNELI